MTTEKRYKVKAPLGNIIVPREVMTEKELRDFFPQLIADPDYLEQWKGEADSSKIAEVIDWMRRAGFEVAEV